MDVPEPYEDEMRRVVNTGVDWWMDKLVPPMENEMPMMYEARVETFGGNQPGWREEFQQDLKDILEAAASQMRPGMNYDRCPLNGSKLRRVGLPEQFCSFSGEMRSLLDSYDLGIEEVGWREDAVMYINPFLLFVRYRQDDESERLYKRPFDLTQA